LWVSLAGALALQMLATHWGPAAHLFGTTGMAWADWGVAAGVASAVLLLEEVRKLGLQGWRCFRAEPKVQALTKPGP
jgi:Ca2+-transporting ATPase